ncbi:hypothetical protein BJ875DRAFT_435552 [Amylocarpus encephaloides]|uniref:Uncharacterized protein n=1 Tax=Amylocarpus encephaloides TaxID=45428 RepID=A0A9P8BZU0_9HELO|nr:hypothetical protein BJ875DRAFT_435552 [Amylocarpus encephaloides]
MENTLPNGNVLQSTVRTVYDGTNDRRAQVLRDVSKFEHAFSKLYAGKSLFLLGSNITNLCSANVAGRLEKQQQFPPPGLQAPSAAQDNPLFGAHSSAALQSQAPTYRAAPPGYPQPLTAGPPGQRQASITSNRQASNPNSIENLWADPSSAFSISESSNLQIESSSIRGPWQNSYPPTASNIYFTGTAQLPQGVLTSPKPARKLGEPIQTKVIVDTLPPDVVAKYYPYLIPADMTGKYTPLSEPEQKKLDAVTWSAGHRAAQKARDLDDWFYMGQRRYVTMDGADFVNELEDRQRLSSISYGPIAPPKKTFPPGPAMQREITPGQMESMSVSDATKPLLDAAFGTYLAYAETGPSSRKYLSSFVPSPKWQIDGTENGNQSCFGEDWGAPPKRFGRDIRRQGNY